ncbi:malonyl-CoA synthase [Rhizobium lentis]|uniref:Malonyl-CoA/methylmalonyl-CoA synthetase n=1 Tax=Rhizobium lentis TaxID=1138194 RepID=A0A7W8XKV8_9HYPH|nr:malonyl-CoA synthase [Rhizobium lentis]MBB4577581.1 malonyl-CoA/methylmalonyl-CoA synthetase [Rhizobium lentis]MBB5554157.1 malonyl-CoA/methylmalonyl-CoA synthetase [Rhizobium lentis]MBB5564770.1 malonyl-CoA/methylmalonyl-CoA synthetase [Rhizobium lentis]MBB5571254.1 malonyl-CoA/methylmalonyl-CoA synthetase [Rhizobium lentis]
MANHLFDAIRNAIPSREKVFIDADDGITWTFGDMLDSSARIANVLRKFGVGAGDRVAAQVEKSAEALMLYLACVRTGAVYLPLNTAYTASELEYFVADAAPKLVVVAPEAAERLQVVVSRAGARLETLGEKAEGTLFEFVADHADNFVDADRKPEDLAAILYTSGTTGRSKGAMLTHDNLLSNALALQAEWHFNNTDRLIHALPLFHAHGLFVAANLTLLSGASMYLLRKFDVDQIFAVLPRATVIMGVPTFYTRLLQDERLTKEATQHMRVFISGSAPLLVDTHRAFFERTGQDILERYGMTETIMITSNPYKGARVPGSVGYALSGVSVRVTDPDTGLSLRAGEPGMVEVRGPNVFKGYWNMPEKTKEEFRSDGFFITGDIGMMEADGRLTIVGRNKDLIISGGYNVYPKEIEQKIDGIEGVVESAVIGLPHPDFGEAVTAVVVTETSANVSEAAIAASVGARLARFKHPKRVILIEDLPRNAMGKVQKNVLRDKYRDLFAQ